MSSSDPLTEAATAGVASAVSKLSTYPFDLLKVRMATDEANKSLPEAIRHIVEKDGVMGLYKGSSPKVFKSVTGKVLYYYIYRTLSNLAIGNEQRGLTAVENLVIGFLSEVLELPVIMPLEAVATRAQVSKKHASFATIAKQLFDENRLYVSVDAYVFGALQPAIQNTIFDQLKAKIARPLTAIESFALGVLASSVALTVAYPLDFARTVNQASGSKKTPKAFNMIIAGAPGSGKGTQCETIAKKFGLVHLSTGDMLRAAVKAGTPVGLAAKAAMSSGGLVSDEIVIGCIQERIAQPDVKERGFLLDGFPRTPEQAEALAKIAPVALYLELQVPDEALVERVVGRRLDPETGDIYHVKFKPAPTAEIQSRLIQRDDDREDKLVVRLKAFHQYCAAVRDRYSACSVTLDGNQPAVLVWEKIETIIRERIGAQAESAKPKNESFLEIWARTIKTNGFLGLFKGLSANLTQGVLSSALMLMVKEKISAIVSQWIQRLRALLSGAKAIPAGGK